MREADLEKKSEASMKLTEILGIVKLKGSKSLKTAREAILKEDIQSKEAREALQYYAKDFLEATAPALIALTCEATGGDADNTTFIGAAIALLVGAVDIHDDIIDRSDTKDGRSTVFGRFGSAIALLTGNALLLEGFALFQGATCALQPEKAIYVAENVKTAFFEMGDAHALEGRLKGKLTVSPERYMHIVRMKSSVWETFARIGAIMGNGSRCEIDALGRYGRNWGILSTLRNDFIDLYDCIELQNRMSNEIFPLPVLCAFKTPQIKREILSTLSRKRTTEEDLETIRDVVLKSHQTKKVKETMQNLVDQSKLCLTTLQESKARAILERFVSSMLEDL